MLSTVVSIVVALVGIHFLVKAITKVAGRGFGMAARFAAYAAIVIRYTGSLINTGTAWLDGHAVTSYTHQLSPTMTVAALVVALVLDGTGWGKDIPAAWVYHLFFTEMFFHTILQNRVYALFGGNFRKVFTFTQTYVADADPKVLPALLGGTAFMLLIVMSAPSKYRKYAFPKSAGKGICGPAEFLGFSRRSAGSSKKVAGNSKKGLSIWAVTYAALSGMFLPSLGPIAAITSKTIATIVSMPVTAFIHLWYSIS